MGECSATDLDNDESVGSTTREDAAIDNVCLNEHDESKDLEVSTSCDITENDGNCDQETDNDFQEFTKGQELIETSLDHDDSTSCLKETSDEDSHTAEHDNRSDDCNEGMIYYSLRSK